MHYHLPLFVYGTLRPGQPNYARYLGGQTAAEAPATLVGAALFTEGPYPFLVTAPDMLRPDDMVRGAIIALRPPVYQLVMADLDDLEGYIEGDTHNLYERIALEVATAEGPRRAWVYVAGAGPLALIRAGELRRVAGGDWQGAA
ncbi:MAG: gamma-glutamylcyclotransferase [Chloroflexales bacterium]|nr:gamma-glutamylcyclotransferase [Chloroflexales bacterium]